MKLSSVEIEGKYLNRERDILEALINISFLLAQTWLRKLLQNQVMTVSRISH